ncbi:MAG TPA: tripartite tricarboxylate transporter substrate binding protein [Burkholderiales bacterium]|nr:tripartite tricarboxylate transporter substrate binding protein [Burkholderiales bacterium]
MKLTGLLLGLLVSISALAQEDAVRSYPSKPIHIVVGYSAGGGNDIIVRVLAPHMQEGLRQPVVVENRPGAQGIIANELVAKSAPDGYTLLMGPSGPMTMNPAIYEKLPYDSLRDYAPITMIGSFPLILVVNPELPARTVKELIGYAKAHPEKANYGASAAPFQLASELFNLKTGTKFQHIPYKGSGDSVNAVVSGQVTMTIADTAPVVGPLKGARVRGLAVTSPQRHPAFPDLPTLMESGVDIEVVLWTAFLAPAKTPAAVVSRIRDEVVRVVKIPQVEERLSQMGIDPVANTPDQFRRIMAQDIAKWTAVAKAAHIKAE